MKEAFGMQMRENQTPSHCVPICAWRHSHFFLKAGTEVVLVGVADLGADHL